MLGETLEPVHPGEILEDFLADTSLTDAARAFGFYVDRSHRNEVLPRDIDRYPYQTPDLGTVEGRRREWAEVFAHELLMPYDEIQVYKRLPRVRLVRRFGVPVPVVNYWVQKLRGS